MINRRNSNSHRANNSRRGRPVLSNRRARKSARGSTPQFAANGRQEKNAGKAKGIVRYAVVGLGHIAQTAVLPAFAHAQSNSQLVAIFSEDAAKRRELQRKYHVERAAAYDEYDSILASGAVDAVFIAEPNSLHRDFAVRAAEAGVHILCEKPLAVTEEECRQMIQAARRNRVKLMTAYRLHFEQANLEAIELVQSGKIGEPRFFNSAFSMQAREGNIRLQKKLGGGTLYDLGVYCINAARYLFRAEPTEALALTANNGDKRFRDVEEMTGAILRFPGERVAAFICSFGAADIANYDIVGTKGSLHLKGAYEYAMPIKWELAVGEKEQFKEYPKRDQFAAELVYFSDCILKSKEPEPSGLEGLNDVHIIRCLYESARKHAAVKIKNVSKNHWPGTHQQIKRPPVRTPPKQTRVQNPSKD